MTHSARRVFRQAIPLAVLILGIGLARQYATGAGLFESGNALVSKVQAAFEDLRAELSPSTEVEAEPEQPQEAAIPSALESRLSEQLAPATFQPQRVQVRQFSFSGAPSGGCRH